MNRSFLYIILLTVIPLILGSCNGKDSRLESPPAGSLQLDPGNFIVQDVPDGQEFFLDIRQEPILDSPSDGGVDLTTYVLEMTFQRGNGKDAQLFFKDCEWRNVYAYPKKITSEEPLRFDPTVDDRNVNEFKDLTCINAVGAKIWGGAQDVEIISVYLIERDAL